MTPGSLSYFPTINSLVLTTRKSQFQTCKNSREKNSILYLHGSLKGCLMKKLDWGRTPCATVPLTFQVIFLSNHEILYRILIITYVHIYVLVELEDGRHVKDNDLWITSWRAGCWLPTLHHTADWLCPTIAGHQLASSIEVVLTTVYYCWYIISLFWRILLCSIKLRFLLKLPHYE